jgi:hypothetical protein
MPNMCKIFKLLISALIAICSWSCKSECETLAYKICECNKTADQVEICKQEVDLRKKTLHEEFKEDNELCKQILENNECDCIKIQQNQVKECTLTRGNQSPLK